MRFFDPDTKKLDGFHILMFAVLLALLACGIAGLIAMGLAGRENAPGRLLAFLPGIASPANSPGGGD